MSHYKEEPFPNMPFQISVEQPIKYEAIMTPVLCFSCQTMPVAMALLRDVQNLCPKDVLNFILDLIKYNDNRKNKVNSIIVMCLLFVCILSC